VSAEPFDAAGGVPAPAHVAASAPERRGATLRSQVEQVLTEYFAMLEGERTCDLYEVVMHEVELPLLISVMAYVGGNQSRAAAVLGLSRGTLRKKLKDHGII
jgi:Fis family transcriptional regulator, factor for inversion stimulation protein